MEQSIKNNLQTFTLKLVAFTAVIWLLFYFGKNYIPQKFYFEKNAFLIVFFFLVTLVFHVGLLRSSKKNNRSTVTFFMMASAVKLLGYLAIIIAYGLLKTGNAISFISTFMMLYLLFTVFEVSSAYSQFQNADEK